MITLIKKTLTVLLILLTGQPAVAQDISVDIYKGFKITGKETRKAPDIIDIKVSRQTEKYYVYSDGKGKPLSGKYHIIISSIRHAVADISNGLQDGEWTVARDNGTVEEKGTYKNGHPVGEYMDHSGSLRKVSTYDNNGEIQHSTSYYSNGQVETEEKYQDGKRSETKKYNKEGKLIDDDRYQNGKRHGKRTEVYMSGATVTSHYNNGTLEGEFIHVNANGVVKEQGTYDAAGKKTGKWIERYEDGSLREEAGYLEGKYHGERRRYDKGVLTYAEEYANGAYHGKVIEYGKYPIIWTEATYTEGRKEGRKQYNDDGTLRYEDLYQEGDMIYRKEYFPDYALVGSVESFYQLRIEHKQGGISRSGPLLVKEKSYDKNVKLKELRLLDEKGKLVVVQEYNTAGKAIKTNKDYKKHSSVTLKEDASGIIDIE